MVELNCAICGAAYTRIPAKATGSRFCSRSCRIAATVNRVQATCGECGISYERPAHRANETRFCSRACKAKWTFRQHPAPNDHKFGNAFAKGSKPNSRSFKPGFIPWNKGTKGVMFANSGSFAPGHESDIALPDGAITARRDKNGRTRNWIKVAGRWNPLAQHVWMQHFGPIPEGHVIHHVDWTSDNDVPENLVALTRSEHIAIHGALRT